MKILGGVACFLIFDAALFSLGNLPFDMTSAKIWAYIASTYGPTELYHLPNMVSLAKVWAGVPYHEAIFPYGPTMAYFFAAVGWVYRIFLSGPGEIVMDTFQLEFIIKGFNVLFGLMDAALIYLILRGMGDDQKRSLTATSLFLFNPAIWFSTSIWGQTQTVSLVFVLGAIYFAQRRLHIQAWLALMAASLTRPQLLIPTIIVGCALLRIFCRRKNLYATSWSVIVAFLLLAPFAWSISPSLPVDYMRSQFVLQAGAANEPELSTVSLDAYSVWPLVTHLVNGAGGLARFHYPSAAPLIGRLSYSEVSLLITLGAALVVSLVTLLNRGMRREIGDYFPLLALGTVSFLMLKTGLAAAHFIIGLPFMILCRRALSNASYYFIIGTWSITTFSSMYGSLGYGIANVPHLAPVLHPSKNVVTQFYMTIMSSDWNLSLNSIANLIVLGLLTFSACPVS